MCMFWIIVTAMLSGTFAAVMLLLVTSGARAPLQTVFPADARDDLLPRDRNGNPDIF